MQDFGLGHNWNRSRCKERVLSHKIWKLNNCFNTVGSIERNSFHGANSYLTHRETNVATSAETQILFFPLLRILISLSLCCRSSFIFFNSSFPASLLVSLSSQMWCESNFSSEILEWFCRSYQKKERNKIAFITWPPAMYLLSLVTLWKILLKTISVWTLEGIKSCLYIKLYANVWDE